MAWRNDSNGTVDNLRTVEFRRELETEFGDDTLEGANPIRVIVRSFAGVTSHEFGEEVDSTFEVRDVVGDVYSEDLFDIYGMGQWCS